MRVALAAGFDARPAANAPVWVDEKVFLPGLHGNLGYC
jgi:hypothetical protein